LGPSRHGAGHGGGYRAPGGGLGGKAPPSYLPRHLLPFANDLSEGELLIEFGLSTERIYYWDFDRHDWGSGITRIGFVANDMYEFVNGLKPDTV
jgi:hypothetical protein